MRSIELNGAYQSGHGYSTATVIFSFRMVKERRRLVEMVKRSILPRFEGGTGGSDHRTEITDKSNRRTHIGNHTLLIVSLLEHYSYLITYSARIKRAGYTHTRGLAVDAVLVLHGV